MGTKDRYDACSWLNALHTDIVLSDMERDQLVADHYITAGIITYKDSSHR